MPDEFTLIDLLLKAAGSSSAGAADIVIGPGDDAAVLKEFSDPLVVSTDTVVESVHFSLESYSAEEVGIKATEAALSDIVAMGGVPRWVLVSISIPESYAGEIAPGIYRGIGDATERTGCCLIGGDTTRSPEHLIISVTAMGVVPDTESLCSRSGARPGQSVYLSGETGRSQAGLIALTEGYHSFDSLVAHHKVPRCRIDLPRKYFQSASAMIDISDGLASELHHLSEQSSCRFVIFQEALPINADIVKLANLAGIDPMTAVLYGGEDYELLFTSEKRDPAEGIYEIGRTEPGEGVAIEDGSGLQRSLDKGGYNHFSLKGST